MTARVSPLKPILKRDISARILATEIKKQEEAVFHKEISIIEPMNHYNDTLTTSMNFAEMVTAQIQRSSLLNRDNS